MNSKIRLLVMDVDGTLTDGKIYMGKSGEAMKAFNIKDGYGIHNILPKKGILPVIITARKSEILRKRCEELQVKELYQGYEEKLSCLMRIIEEKQMDDVIKYTLKNVAYIGDDLVDLTCMLAVKKAGGIVGCPADAVDEIKEISDFISKKNAGDGAVREFIDWLK